MAANTSPIFTLVPNTGQASVAEANTASDGSGTLATLFTAGANGSRIEGVRYQNAQVSPAASSAMVFRLFLTNSSGTSPMLIGELAVPTATRSASAAGAGGYYGFTNALIIKAGQILKVGQSVYAGTQDLMHYTAFGGDY